MLIPEPVQRLIDAFSRLPGVGPKTASRLAFVLLRDSENLSLELAQALEELKAKTGFCQQCFHVTSADRELCQICEHHQRNAGLICVVEEPLDVLAIERTHEYKGHYHVLHGALSPIEGVGPEDIKINQLIERVKKGGIEEVIIATNPSMEGDSTAMYLRQQLLVLKVKVTRLARGLPMGGDLEYADQNTLSRALAGRHEMED